MFGLAALYSDFNVISVAHQSKKQAYQVKCPRKPMEAYQRNPRCNI